MMQRGYRQIREVDTDAKITIATSRVQVSAINNQLKGPVGICVEPCRRDTFPAIALATAYLHDVKGVPTDDVVVCPVDLYVDKEYFQMLKELEVLVHNENAKLTLMGVEPTYPSEKYGYIIPKEYAEVSMIDTFTEKTDAETAEKYISQGALWNAGIFAYKLKYVLEKSRGIVRSCRYDDLLAGYDELPRISFDYAVVEGETNIQVRRFSGEWKDLGTWNTLTEAMAELAIGNVICDELHVFNELNVPILCMGA